MNEQDHKEILGRCAYKEHKDLSSEELYICGLEGKLCQINFFRFLKWVRLIVPPVQGQTGGGIIQFKVTPHIEKFAKILLTKPLISVLKARQIYISTTLAAYHLWMAHSKLGANLLLFSKGQPEAKELLAKSHRMHDLLPPFMKLKINPDSTEELGFPEKKSSIKAFPSTQSAGISYTASCLTCDEHAEHPYADENYMSTKPTRYAGGQFISVFTADPYSNDNLATVIFQDALDGKNGFTPVFFPYDVIEGRDGKWLEQTLREIPERDIARISPALYKAKMYPSSIEEALSLATSVSVFDKNVLNIMMEDAHGQVNEGEDWDIDNKVCHIYKNYHIGNSYIAATDVSLGVGGDYNVTVIMDVKTGNIVADIMSKEISPEVLAFHSVQLLKHYHNPLWWIEHNLYGRTVIKKAVELGYRRLGYRGDKPILWSTIDDNETLKRVGFFTDDKSRGDLFGDLIPAINDQQIKIYNAEGLKQFKSMIRNVNKQGKIEATSSAHDDYVMAVGIGWLKRNDVKTNSSKTIPTRTLDFVHYQQVTRR